MKKCKLLHIYMQQCTTQFFINFAQHVVWILSYNVHRSYSTVIDKIQPSSGKWLSFFNNIFTCTCYNNDINTEIVKKGTD